ncbi:MAG: TetR/AcrR family transcriptional regulator [Solirubrobacterales bacterium]
MPRSVTRSRRADAERSITAILDAAVEVLSERPEASMEEIAGAAGVSRQTVYAHYSSREALLDAVSERALSEAVAAIDAAEPQQGPPADALERLVAASWRTVSRHARLLDSLHALRSAEELHAFHAPILERLERLIRRGRRAGVFDRQQPTGWLLSTVLSLSHAAAAEVRAGRMTPEDAGRALRRSVLRVFGAEA